MRPTWRVLGAIALSAVLEAYGQTSEVSWLFLLSDWVLVLVPVTFAYFIWNRSGLRLELGLRGATHVAGSPALELPEQVLRTCPSPTPVFEGDTLRLELGLRTTGAARGPAWIRGRIAGEDVEAGTGLVSRSGWSTEKVVAGVRRGPVGATGWKVLAADPLGFFRGSQSCADKEVAVVLPRFSSLAARVESRELEAAAVSPRAGAGNELFGVREYHAGDSLRRIHWRSSAHRGELIVREYEPPGAQTLAIYLDPTPRSREVADQVARIAASEAWDCVRDGGRVVLWAPGLEASAPLEGADMWQLLEWLARYPGTPADESPPRGNVAVVVSGAADPSLVDALEEARRRGSRVRAWIVGDADLDVDAPVEHVGTEWPL
jgi:uncharacterized protein (DUF58 family)